MENLRLQGVPMIYLRPQIHESIHRYDHDEAKALTRSSGIVVEPVDVRFGSG